MAEAYTGSPSAKITEIGFYYTARGAVNNTFELTPHSGGYYQVYEGYWANGLPQVFATNISGLPQWSYTPDGEGRISSVSASSGQNPLTGATYGPFGATALTLGSGDSDTFTYDPNTGRQTQYAFHINGTTESGTLTWNANGTLQQLAISDPFLGADNQTCNNTYDDLERLIGNNCGSPGWSQTFSYDVFGNMTQSGSASFLPTYNAATNQYATLPSGTPSYSATGAINNDGLHSYYWDSENKNLQLDSSVFMTYDAFGRWVERNASGVYYQALYAPDGSEFAVMSGSSVVSAYVHLPQGAMATAPGGGAGVTAYLHPDWLGTPRLYTDPSHGIIGDTAFSPYGEQYQGPSIDTFFTGAAQLVEANDSRTFPARNLSVVEGRWLSPDPAGLAAVDITNPQSLNRYAYVLGNPLAYTDPSGLCTSTDGNPCYDVTSKPACSWWKIWCWGGSSGGTPEDFDQFYTSTLAFLNAGPSCTNCGGNNGTKSAPPAKSGTSSAPPSRLSCLSQAYATPEGKAVQFLSPISLTPLNPNWHENLAEWGLAIFGKGGGMVGSGLGAAVLEKGGLESAYSIGTLTQIHNVAAPIERALGKGLHYGEEAMLPAMAAMTLADALLQAQCAANPSAPLNGIEIGPK